MSRDAPRGIDLVGAVADLPSHETERLMLAATGWSRDRLLAGRRVDGNAAATFDAYVNRRRRGEPLQYIEGTVQFGPLELRCDPRALIPRPETEQLWEHVVAEYDGAPEVIVDLGTGSGNLALLCKHTWPSAVVYGTDVSGDALALAAANVALTGLDVALLRGDLFDPLPERLVGSVDIVVSNPPYLAHDELASLDAEVSEHEPHTALTAGDSGVEVLARIAEQAGRWLRPGGLIACEISEFHGRRIEALFAAHGGAVRRDLTGRDRFVIGRVTAP